MNVNLIEDDQGTKHLFKLLEDLRSWIDLWLLIEDLSDERENPNFLYGGGIEKLRKD